MRLTTAIMICLFFYCSFAGAQTLNTGQLLDAWKASDTSQTTRAEITYADLKHHADPIAYRTRMAELNAYLKENPNERLQIRTWMYMVLGKYELSLPRTHEDRNALIKAMKMADLMGDDQLLSELYSLYPRIDSVSQNFSYYILRSIEMQQEIGTSHFPQFYLRLLNFSISMYGAGEYRECIAYGTKALRMLSFPLSDQKSKMRILQADYIGNSYKKLNMPDSVLYYYNAIEQYIPAIAKTDNFHNIWEGVAAGGKGQALVMQKKYEEAKPYLYKNIRSSIQYNELADAALSQDALAKVFFAENKSDSALYYWRSAYQNYGEDISGKIDVSKNLSELFSRENLHDSSFFYYRKHYELKSKLDEQHRDGKLAALQTRIDFNDMENSLAKAKNAVEHEKNIRLFLLLGVAFLAITAFLIYNRYRLKQKYLIEQANNRHKLATIEVQQAKKQIKDFTDKIKDRETLIEQLRANLESNAATLLEDRLQEYSLVTNEEWEIFRTGFIKAYPRFYPAVQKIAGQLTPSEERLTALIHLQLSSVQIAATLGIARESVSRTRLNLPEDTGLESFLIALS